MPKTVLFYKSYKMQKKTDKTKMWVVFAVFEK